MPRARKIKIDIYVPFKSRKILVNPLQLQRHKQIDILKEIELRWTYWGWSIAMEGYQCYNLNGYILTADDEKYICYVGAFLSNILNTSWTAEQIEGHVVFHLHERKKVKG